MSTLLCSVDFCLVQTNGQDAYDELETEDRLTDPDSDEICVPFFIHFKEYGNKKLDIQMAHLNVLN